MMGSRSGLLSRSSDVPDDIVFGAYHETVSFEGHSQDLLSPWILGELPHDIRSQR